MTSYAVNASILLTDLPLLQRPAAVAAAGFRAVEFWWPFAVAVPTDPEIDAFVAAISDAGVQLSGLNFFAGNMPAGDRGLVSWVGRESEFRDNVEVVAGIGERARGIVVGLLHDRIRVPVVYPGKFATTFLFIGFAGLLFNAPLIPGLGWCDISWLPGFNGEAVSWGIWFIYAGLILSLGVTIYYTVAAARALVTASSVSRSCVA